MYYEACFLREYCLYDNCLGSDGGVLVRTFCVLFFCFAKRFVDCFVSKFVPNDMVKVILLFLTLTFGIIGPGGIGGLSALLARGVKLFFLPTNIKLVGSLNVVSRC